ncbi:hypothetical protein J5491_03690 [Candidatus Saccharibacteria bacterium]|nr:hypothetical protein [Candidatus Saccharibacteria bacterium]
MSNTEQLKGFANAEGAQDKNGNKISPDALVMPSGASTHYNEKKQIKERQEQVDQSKAERNEALRKTLRKLGFLAATLALSGGIVLAGKGYKETVDAERQAQIEAENQNNGAKLSFNIHSDPNTNIISGQLVAPNGQVYVCEGAPGDTEEQVKNRLVGMMDEDNQKAEKRNTIEY